MTDHSASPDTPQYPHAAPVSVLLIEDDEVDRMIVRRALAAIDPGIEVQEADTVAAGLRAAAERFFDCVFLDYMLPDGDGLSALAALLEGGSARPVIMLTGHGDERVAVAALKAGAADYLPKGTLSAEGLLRTVQQVMRVDRAERERRAAQQAQMALGAKLRETERQLMQSEKMASIGQLAAGVAHEINNPISFVNSNVGTFRQYVTDLLHVIAAYERVEAQLPDGVLVADVHALKKRLDLALIKDDALALIDESQEGLRRVQRIVQDLREFSHVGEDEWLLVDLHRGLDSTLGIARNELKYKADVVTEYGRLPEVECRASQINQVFMNLLVNAAQAIEGRGTINVRTGAEGADWVWVEVADDGVGIAPGNLERIFEPFFTTKPVGQGTGLGLALAYGIVDRHGGRIEVSSEPGRGSTFRVWLPCRRGVPGAPDSSRAAGRNPHGEP